MEFPVGSVLVCRTLPDIKAGVFRAKRVAAATIRLRGFQCQEENWVVDNWVPGRTAAAATNLRLTLLFIGGTLGVL